MTLSKEESEEKSLEIERAIEVQKKKWRQRDIEEQINEELELKEKQTKMATQPKKIKVSEVLDLLRKGYTRYTKDDKGKGSIQANYGLTGVEVKKLFQDSRLKNRKTAFTRKSNSPGFVLEEDVEAALESGEITAEEAIDQKEALFS